MQDQDFEARLAALERAYRRITPTEAVTLREHIESQLAASQRAVDLATNAMEKRLNGMNEFRDTLRDQAARFMTRSEVDLLLKPINAQVAAIQTFIDKLSGKADTKSLYIGYAIAGLSLALSVIGLLK